MDLPTINILKKRAPKKKLNRQEAGGLFRLLRLAPALVLRSLLVEAGVSEMETAAALDRFVFEVNFRLESTGECLLDGFGVLKSGVNGTV